jgi:hypothetical protein
LRRRRRFGVRPGALVVFACLCASPWCNPRGEWGTLAPNLLLRQRLRRWAPPLVVGRPLPPAPTCVLDRRIVIQRIRSVRLMSKPPPPVNPRLDLAVLQTKPRGSLDLQAGPPTVIVSSQIGPVFFVLAQEV